MNALWAGMMLMAIIYGTFHGTIPAVTQAALDSAKEAVSLCITMLGILSFWMGLMQIGTASGLVERLTKGVEPLLRRLFPRIPAGHPAMGQIALNCIANMLGLGMAATPAGLKAMQEMETDTTNTIFIGDQIFTDVYGANLAGIRTILVKPIHPKEEIQIVLKRYLEKIVLFFYARYQKKQNR